MVIKILPKHKCEEPISPRLTLLWFALLDRPIANKLEVTGDLLVHDTSFIRYCRFNELEEEI